MTDAFWLLEYSAIVVWRLSMLPFEAVGVVG